MPQEITKPTPLLKEDGSTVVGWASSNLLDYNKIDCAAPLARIKRRPAEMCMTLNIRTLTTIKNKVAL